MSNYIASVRADFFFLMFFHDTTADTAGLSFLGERDDARQSPVTAEHP